MKRNKLNARSKKPHRIYEEYLDQLWATIIKLRDKGIDQYSLSTKGISIKGRKTDCHHIFSRKLRNTRWDTRNGILVMGLHNYHEPHVHPIKFHEWLRNSWFKTPIEYDMLKVRSELIGVQIDRSAMEIALTQELREFARIPFDWYTLSFNKKKKYLLTLRKVIY